MRRRVPAERVVRISSNPAFTPEAVTAGHAMALLERIVTLPGHDFWPDGVPLTALVSAAMLSHRQVTGAYLLALAMEHDGVLATMDRGVKVLARNHQDRVEIVSRDPQ
jgi:hypothetical protein